MAGYWALTTLSTVGFGDFVPTTNFERLTGVISIFCAYVTFSYINGSLLAALEDLSVVTSDYDDSDRLE